MSEDEIRKIGQYLELKYVIARDVNKNDLLETQDKYIQKLYDAYLDLKIKYNQLQLENKKIKYEQTFYEKLDSAIEDLKNIKGS